MIGVGRVLANLFRRFPVPKGTHSIGNNRSVGRNEDEAERDEGGESERRAK